MGGQSSCVECGGIAHDERALDMTPWESGPPMSHCASSQTPAACYRSICAGKKSGDPTLQSSWALPHHKRPGGPANLAAVRNALARLPQTQGLTNTEQARTHLQRHLAEQKGANSMGIDPNEVFRAAAWAGACELRESSDDAASGMPMMVGHFAVFDEWTEIHSFFEGDFLERLDRGAFDRTFQEDRDRMRVLFQHGRDSFIGDKPLGPIDTLEADKTGAYYEVPLLDTAYNRDHLLPGLRAGLYGASFRFQVERQEWVDEPEPSKYNPRGLSERTILDATVREFGPVTFPAYANATAGVRSELRSLTDYFYGVMTPDNTDLTGAPGARSAGRGDLRDAGRGAQQPSPASMARHRGLLLEGVINV